MRGWDCKSHPTRVLLKTCTRPQMKANEIYLAMNYKPMPFHRKTTILSRE